MRYSIDPHWEYTEILTPELLLELAQVELIETQEEMHTRYVRICEMLTIARNQLQLTEKNKGGKND